MEEEKELEEKLSMLERNPLNPSLIKQIGLALYHLEEYETAKIFFERVDLLEPNKIISEKLGDCYFQLGQHQLALEKYKNAHFGCIGP